jgi:hypothetical protein
VREVLLTWVAAFPVASWSLPMLSLAVLGAVTSRATTATNKGAVVVAHNAEHARLFAEK